MVFPQRVSRWIGVYKGHGQFLTSTRSKLQVTLHWPRIKMKKNVSNSKKRILVGEELVVLFFVACCSLFPYVNNVAL